MNYVDGYVMPMPKKNIAAYKKMAMLGSKVWMDHGALEYFECIGDDLNGMPGCQTFPKIANAKKDETIVFAFVVFKSKKHRDQVNKKVMKDPRMEPEQWKNKPMPFDASKMAYGGFQTLVYAKH